MATHTLPISQRTVPVGQTTFGPFSIGNNTQGTVTIDRTPAGGLNSLTAATTFAVEIQSSPDGGVTWQSEAALFTIGGTFTDKHGQINTNAISVFGMSGARNSCRVVVTVGGPSSIVLSGSASVS